MFQTKLPENFLWRSPNFPSIVLSYSESNSLFYSGPIGIMIICGLEFKKNSYVKMFYLSILTFILELILLLILRGNYVIDIFTAILFSHYSFMISEEFSYKIDKIFFKTLLNKDNI